MRVFALLPIGLLALALFHFTGLFPLESLLFDLLASLSFAFAELLLLLRKSFAVLHFNLA